MTRDERSSQILHFTPLFIGGLMVLFGVMSVGYGIWAWVESLAYLDEVAASGQTVAAFEASGYIMSSAGLFILIGLVLMSQAGLIFVVRPLLARPEPQPQQDESDTSPSSRETHQEDDLDALLEDVRD